MAEQHDMLWQLALDHRQAGRHHESLREAVTALAIGITVGTVAFSFKDSQFDAREIAYGFIAILAGIGGLLLSMKHYERFEHHYDKYASIKRHLSRALDLQISDIEKGECTCGCVGKGRENAGEKPAKQGLVQEPWIKAARLWQLWNAIHISAIAIGAVLVMLGVYSLWLGKAISFGPAGTVAN